MLSKLQGCVKIEQSDLKEINRPLDILVGVTDGLLLFEINIGDGIAAGLIKNVLLEKGGCFFLFKCVLL